ncbi:MAG: PD40 domain-containing protein [Alphaproteobacteria bacterium]|nr:PD40 domain-containing protein [Alphaproteobacteria bacterium]MBV9540850.1 PD40 domain-containing protein [Alphaproteobacteria bacterium]
MREWISAAVAGLVLAGAANAATVSADHGNIVVNGKAIMTSGHDSAPVLSPDGKRVVFVRTSDKTRPDCSASGADTDEVELWVVSTDGSGAHKLLGIAPSVDMHKTVCGFNDVQFSSDGALLYFQTPAWATSGAIHVYDFKSGKEHFVVDGDELIVLNRCDAKEYRDHLIVTQHKYFVFGGSYDWPWLISPAGKVEGLVGGDEVKLDEIVKEACS